MIYLLLTVQKCRLAHKKVSSKADTCRFGRAKPVIVMEGIFYRVKKSCLGTRLANSAEPNLWLCMKGFSIYYYKVRLFK